VVCLALVVQRFRWNCAVYDAFSCLDKTRALHSSLVDRAVAGPHGCRNRDRDYFWPTILTCASCGSLRDALNRVKVDPRCRIRLQGSVQTSHGKTRRCPDGGGRVRSSGSAVLTSVISFLFLPRQQISVKVFVSGVEIDQIHFVEGLSVVRLRLSGPCLPTGRDSPRRTCSPSRWHASQDPHPRWSQLG